ncbi:MAG: protein kinase domain-containing protein [Terriglobales bacterium]
MEPEPKSASPSDSTASQPASSAGAAPAATLSPGDLIASRFRVVRRLGHGGMGEVYEADDLELHERVALKTVLPAVARNEHAMSRFRREVHLARKVTHPNVCRIFDVFRHRTGPGQETTFLSMELLGGETLAERLGRSGRMALDEASPIVRQMTGALAAAHAAGVVHRDFKTGNVILVPSKDEAGGTRAVVTDFGLAHGGASSESLTASAPASGGFAGTPAYMAPEQVEGREVTAATDLYALGLVMYEMVTGARPFEAETPLASAVRRLKEPPRSPRAYIPGLDPRWEAAILCCLQRNPADRFASADDVLRALGGEPVPIPSRRRRALLAAAAAAGLLIAGVAYYLGRQTPVIPKPGDGVSSLPSKPRRSVAVLGFKNASARGDMGWLSTALSEMLTTELAATENLRTIRGETVARMKLDLGLIEAEAATRDSLRRIRSNLGADLVVAGSYTVLGQGARQQIRLDLRLEDAVAGETVVAIAETGKQAELFDLVSRAGGRLRDKLGVGTLSAAEASSVRAALPANLEATRLYSEGLEKLRRFDALAARDLLERAVRSDPNHAPTRSALAAAWAALGYEERAREEARRAVELASRLSPRERSSIEARYREVTKDWPNAIQIYTSLTKSFPDDLEYGLSLAAAQTSSGNGKDALTTIAGLRQLPPPAGEDPRLDLAEATATTTLADFKRSQAAAASAVEKSRRRGSQLLAANAQLIQARAFMSLGEPQKAQAVLEEARQAFSARGDRTGAARATTNIGNMRYIGGDPAGALRLYEESLSAYLHAGNKAGASLAFNNIGNVLDALGNRPRSRRMYQASLATSREINDKNGIARALGNLGSLSYEEGNLAEAARLFAQSGAIFKEVGNRGDEATALQNLGSVYVQQGSLGRARQMFEQTLAIYREMGDQSSVALVLNTLADLLEKEDDLVGAAARAEEALALQSQLGEKSSEAQSRLLLASLYQEMDRPREAEASARKAEAEFQAAQMADEEAAAHNLLAQLLLGQGKVAEAQKEAERASALLEKSSSTSEKLSLEITVARLVHASGKTTEALRSLNATIASARTSELAGREFEARLALGEIEMAAGKTAAAKAHLQALRREARVKGYGLFARKAETVITQAVRR